MIYDCDVLVRQKIWQIGVSVEAENKEEGLEKAQDLDWEDCMETEAGKIEEVLEVDFYD